MDEDHAVPLQLLHDEPFAAEQTGQDLLLEIDADGDPLSFAWVLTSLPAGSSAVLSDSLTASPTFFADVPGSYIVQLVVNDGTDPSPAATTSANIAAANEPPGPTVASHVEAPTGGSVILKERRLNRCVVFSQVAQPLYTIREIGKFI